MDTSVDVSVAALALARFEVFSNVVSAQHNAGGAQFPARLQTASELLRVGVRKTETSGGHLEKTRVSEHGA